MRKKEPTEWVVYRAAVDNNLGGHNAVCSQEEWEALALASPGHHTLIRERIQNEAEAERYARSLQTVPPVPKVVKPTALALRKQAERVARLAAFTAGQAAEVKTADDPPAAVPEPT